MVSLADVFVLLFDAAGLVPLGKLLESLGAGCSLLVFFLAIQDNSKEWTVL